MRKEAVVKRSLLWSILWLLVLLVVLVVSCLPDEREKLEKTERLEKLDRASQFLLENRQVVSPIIDGAIEPGEWDEWQWAAPDWLTVYLTNDKEYLYLAIEARHDTKADQDDSFLLCFITGENFDEIRAGSFKSLRVTDGGITLWQDWDKEEKLPVKNPRESEVYEDGLIARLEAGGVEAIRVYERNGDVFAFFAEDISDIPAGIIAKTGFSSGKRHYEIRIPLHLLDIQAGDEVRVFGYVHDAARPMGVHYPNFRTKFMSWAPWEVEMIPLR